MTAQEVIIAVAVGATDIKIVTPKDEVYEVLNTRAFHNWLEKNLSTLTFLNPNEAQEKEIKLDSRVKINFENEQFIRKDQDAIETIDANEIRVCLPKLMPPLQALKNKHELNIVGGIVYYTDRRDSPEPLKDERDFRKIEPFAVGAVTQKWLSEFFSLESKSDELLTNNSVVAVNFAKGKSTLEGLGRDFPIKRSVCQQIETPLRVASKLYPNAKIILSTLGGISSANSVFKDASKLFFNQVEVLNHPEGSTFSTEHLEFDDARNTVNDSYYQRQLINQFIKGYNFSAAHIVGQQAIEQDILSEGQWAKPLKSLSAYLEGKNFPNAQYSKSFPEKHFLSNKLGFAARSYALMMRINLALTHKHIPLALQLTLALPNAVRLDAMARYLLILDGKHKDAQLKNSFNDKEVLNSFFNTLSLPSGLHTDIYGDLSKLFTSKKDDVAPVEGGRKENRKQWLWQFSNEILANLNKPKEGALLQAMDAKEKRTLISATEPMPEIYPLIKNLVTKLGLSKIHDASIKDYNLASLATNALIGDLTDTQKTEITQIMQQQKIWQENEQKQFMLNEDITESIIAAFGYEQTPLNALEALKEETAQLVKEYQII